MKYFMFDWSIYTLFELSRGWNDDIRKYSLDMKHDSTKNVFWDVNNKKWRKRCKFVSLFIFNNNYGIRVHIMETKCRNQVFYVWLVDLQTYCAKYGLEIWVPPNNDIGICLLGILKLKTRFEMWITRRNVNGDCFTFHI
jgi:hypothetical protein